MRENNIFVHAIAFNQWNEWKVNWSALQRSIQLLFDFSSSSVYFWSFSSPVCVCVCVENVYLHFSSFSSVIVPFFGFSSDAIQINVLALLMMWNAPETHTNHLSPSEHESKTGERLQQPWNIPSSWQMTTEYLDLLKSNSLMIVPSLNLQCFNIIQKPFSIGIGQTNR